MRHKLLPRCQQIVTFLSKYGADAVSLPGTKQPAALAEASANKTLEHRMGFEPMHNGFAGRRVSHFATRAHVRFAVFRRKLKSPSQYRWDRGF